MANKDAQNNFGNKIMEWQVKEYEQHERGKGWYWIVSILAILLLVYCFLTQNFLFAVIIIMAAIIIIINDGQNPLSVNITLTAEGIVVGKKFYDYDEFKNFAIVYKPRQGVKNLYFEFKNSMKYRLSIPLEKSNPLSIRETLLKYVDEDLERTDQPLSETLSKMFKL